MCVVLKLEVLVYLNFVIQIKLKQIIFTFFIKINYKLNMKLNYYII